MTDEERIKRCREIPGEITALRQQIVALAAERARLVHELRQPGRGLGLIGEMLGISKGRVQQIDKTHVVRP